LFACCSTCCHAEATDSSTTPGVDRGGVGDHLGSVTFSVDSARRKNLPSRVGVAAGRDEDVDDLPVLVDRPVHVPPHRR
jgi:hypothetical protein